MVKVARNAGTVIRALIGDPDKRGTKVANENSDFAEDQFSCTGTITELDTFF